MASRVPWTFHICIRSLRRLSGKCLRLVFLGTLLEYFNINSLEIHRSEQTDYLYQYINTCKSSSASPSLLFLSFPLTSRTRTKCQTFSRLISGCSSKWLDKSFGIIPIWSQLTLSSKDPHKYEIEFQEAIRMLCEETESRRLWISSKWTDTPEGNGKEVKLLDYACGPGYISRVCVLSRNAVKRFYICLETNHTDQSNSCSHLT